MEAFLETLRGPRADFVSIRDHFDPRQTGLNIPAPIRSCLKLMEGCYSLKINVSDKKKKRIGNIILDLTTFRRQRIISSWEFEALFVIANNKVVYKTWHGNPKKENYQDKIQPLGPFQEIGKAMSVIPL